MTDFLGQCVKTSCGLLDSGSGGGTALTDNNKLLGVGDKNIGSTDATNVNFLSDNKVRAVLDSKGNFDVRDLRTSEVDILPNQQFQVVSGTATLSNFESTITTTSESDEYKTKQEFTPDTAPSNSFSEDVYVRFDGSSTGLNFGVIDTLGNITLCASSPLTIASGDVLNLYLFKTVTPPGQVFISGGLNGVAISGVQLTTNLDLQHQFYYTGYNGACSITRSKVNSTEQKGSINLVDNHNFGLSIREDGKDYLNIDTLNDSMVLQNLTDINNGSISFNNNEIVITKEIVGSQESMIPNDSIVQLSSFSSLSGELLTITADETNITIPITPSFQVGDKFGLTLNIDKQTVGSNAYYIGVGEYSVPPLIYLPFPTLIYPTNTFYSTGSGFGGMTFPGPWNIEPNHSAPNYNTTGLFEIKLVLEESGEFNLYIDNTIKFSMTLVGINTFECYIFAPSQGTCEFDTSYASMLSGDGGVVIDGYPIAQTFNQLLNGDPNTGVMTFKQVNTQGLIIGDELGIPDPTTDNSLRFGQGGGTVSAEILTLESEFKTSFVSSGIGAEVVKIDHSNANLDMLGYHIKSDRIDIGSYQANIITLQPTTWTTLFNATATGSLWNQVQSTARGVSEGYTLNTGITQDFVFEIKQLAFYRHWVGIADNNLSSNSLNPTTQAFWYKVSVSAVTEDNILKSYTSSSSFTDVVTDTGVTYGPGDKIKFEINSSNEVRVYLNTGSGYNQISTSVYTIPNGTVFYGKIVDGSAVGSPPGTAIDLQVSEPTPDFTSKTNKINIYNGTDIQFENDLKISRDVDTNDDWINLDVTNNEIDIFRDIQSTGNISCVTLTTDTALFPVGTTSKMLALSGSAYTGQLFYTTDDGGKLCIFNGTVWMPACDSFQATNATASTTLLRGQPVTLAVNPRGVIQILTSGSNLFNGIVCFEDATAGSACVIADHGEWNVLADIGTYNTGDTLQTSSTGRSRTAGASSQTWAVVLESIVLSSPGLVRCKLRIYPP